MKKTPHLALSVVIPMRNSSSTILKTLESIFNQKYPIKEIIVIDNASTDKSVEVVKGFILKHKRIPTRLLINAKDLMIARSLSRGIKAAKTPYVVLTHSDCRFVTSQEIQKLARPFQSNSRLVATYGQVKQSLSTWHHYSFWEKFLFAFQAGKTIPGLVGKVDCINKLAYLRAGGHDTKGHDNYGGEDADLHARLKKIGPTQETKATIEHLHYLYGDFSFKDLLEKKQQTAGAYGVLLRTYGIQNGFVGLITFLLKPVLAITILLPMTRFYAVLAFIVFTILYYHRMFMTKSTLFSPRIIILPFAVLFLIFFETLWTFAGFFRSLLFTHEKLPSRN
jgi:glycosyltransferase involved in cell wall biosynthesis